MQEQFDKFVLILKRLKVHSCNKYSDTKILEQILMDRLCFQTLLFNKNLKEFHRLSSTIHCPYPPKRKRVMLS